MSRRGGGRDTAARMVGYQIEVAPADETRVEKLLQRAERAGVVHRGQWDGSRGFFWWNGVPGKKMRALRRAVGGASVPRAALATIA